MTLLKILVEHIENEKQSAENNFVALKSLLWSTVLCLCITLNIFLKLLNFVVPQNYTKMNKINEAKIISFLMSDINYPRSIFFSRYLDNSYSINVLK